MMLTNATRPEPWRSAPHYPETADRWDSRDNWERYEIDRYRPRVRIGFTAPEEMPERYETRIDNHYGTIRRTGGAKSMTRPAAYSDQSLTREEAESWVKEMHNADGTTGGKWTMEQARQQMAQRGINCDPVEFYVALNMMYSDYGKVAKELGVSNLDFYAKMAQAFLTDEDADPDKLARYYHAVAER